MALATTIVKVFNSFERDFEHVALCDDCLSRIVDNWGYPQYSVVEELDEPVECENEDCWG